MSVGCWLTYSAVVVVLHVFWPSSLADVDTQASDAIQMVILPAGPVLEGHTIWIVCQIPGMDHLDSICLVKQSTDGGTNTDYEITTNSYIDPDFEATGRYRVTTWEPDEGLLELEIKDVQGEDSGLIGCRQLPSGQSTFTDLVVNVPPGHVELRYRVNASGDEYIRIDDDVIQLQQDVPAAIRCYVTVRGAGDVEPHVSLELDDVDVTSHFRKLPAILGRASGRGGLVRAEYAAIFEWKFGDEDVEEMLALHDKNLTCRATMPYYQSKETSTLVRVKPQWLTTTSLLTTRDNIYDNRKAKIPVQPAGVDEPSRATVFTVSTCDRDEEVNFLCTSSQGLQIRRFVWSRTPYDTAEPDQQTVTDECLNETASTLEARWNCNGRVGCTLTRNMSTNAGVCSGSRKCLFAQYSCLKYYRLSAAANSGKQTIKCPMCPIIPPCTPAPTPEGGGHLFGPHEDVEAVEIALIVVICVLAVGHVISAVFLVRWLIARWKKVQPAEVDEPSRGELTLQTATVVRRLSIAAGGAVPPAPPPPTQHFAEPLHFKKTKKKKVPTATLR